MWFWCHATEQIQYPIHRVSFLIWLPIKDVAGCVPSFIPECPTLPVVRTMDPSAVDCEVENQLNYGKSKNWISRAHQHQGTKYLILHKFERNGHADVVYSVLLSIVCFKDTPNSNNKNQTSGYHLCSALPKDLMVSGRRLCSQSSVGIGSTTSQPLRRFLDPLLLLVRQFLCRLIDSDDTMHRELVYVRTSQMVLCTQDRQYSA